MLVWSRSSVARSIYGMTLQPDFSHDPADIDVQIGARVHQLMWQSRMTQTELGRMLGLTQPAISKKLRGERPWYAAEVISVARALATSAAYLYGEAENPRPQSEGGGSDLLPRLDLNQRPSD